MSVFLSRSQTAEEVKVIDAVDALIGLQSVLFFLDTFPSIFLDC